MLLPWLHPVHVQCRADVDDPKSVQSRGNHNMFHMVNLAVKERAGTHLGFYDERSPKEGGHSH